MDRGARRLVTVVFLIAFIHVHLPAEVYLGVRKGLNLSTQYGYDRGSLHGIPKCGFVGGIFMTLRLSQRWTLQPEILFSMKGRTDENSDRKESLSMSYLDFPLLLKYSLAGSRVRLSAYTGLQLSVLLSGILKEEGQEETVLVPLEPEDYHAVDMGLLLGAEIAVPVGAHLVSLGVRTTLGFLPVLTEGRPRNLVFALTMGYAFRL